MKEKLSVVIPVYNESDVIEEVIRKYYKEIIKKYPGSEMIIAEDGSTDGTKEILRKLAKKLPIKLVMGDERKGYMKAAKDAIMLAKGDIIFFSDSDNTHDPKDFWKMLDALNGNDIVAGVKENRMDPFYRKFLSIVYNKFFLWLFFGLSIRDSNAGFKLMRRRSIQDIVPEIRHLKYGFSSELLIRANYNKRKIVTVPVSHFERKTGVADQFPLNRVPKIIW